jgi:hypothetical protein
MVGKYTFSGTEDWNEVSAQKPNEVLGVLVEVQVVAKRCVYLNHYRIAGAKPYFTEHLPSHTLKCTLRDIIDAFPEDQLLAAITERREQREYFDAYRAARAATEAAQNGGEP